MRRFLLFYLLVVISCFPASLALSEDNVPDDDVFKQWMVYYYTQPNSAGVPMLLRWLDDNTAFNESDMSIYPSAAFLGALLHKNPQLAMEWFSAIPQNSKVTRALSYAIILSGKADEIDEFKGKTSPSQTALLPSLADLPLNNPGNIDMMWWAFYASGDPVYIRRIIDILGAETQVDQNLRAAVMGSIRDNMISHAYIYRIVKAEQRVRRGQVKERLDDVFADYHQKIRDVTSPFDVADGEFSAMMLVVSPESLLEFEKPADHPLNLKHLEKTRRGSEAAVTILFTGPEVADKSIADVTFDLQIFAPDGTLYGQEFTGMSALQAPIAIRHRVFHNKSLIMIRFEPADMLGTYRIEADLYDKVADKKLRLTQHVTLLE